MSLKPLFDRFTFINRFVIDAENLGGDVEAFDDSRFVRLDDLFPLAGRRVLELGPLEGVQTIQMHQRGASEIVAVEGRVDNLYKWCLIKELYRLDRARIHFGDLDEVDFRELGGFDFCLCFGVLYHLSNPADLLQRIAEVTDRVYVWTHVAGAAYPESEEATLGGASRASGEPYLYAGKFYYEVEEPRAALREASFWPYESEVVRMLEDCGFDDVRILERGTMYGTAPVVLLYAQRASRESAQRASEASGTPGDHPFEGWVDVVNQGQVAGWVWLPDSPSARVRVTVIVDGRVVARPLACELRSDLRAAGKGDGCHGFTVNFLDGQVTQGSVIRVSVDASREDVPVKPHGP